MGLQLTDTYQSLLKASRGRHRSRLLCRCAIAARSPTRTRHYDPRLQDVRTSCAPLRQRRRRRGAEARVPRVAVACLRDARRLPRARGRRDRTVGATPPYVRFLRKEGAFVGEFSMTGLGEQQVRGASSAITRFLTPAAAAADVPSPLLGSGVSGRLGPLRLCDARAAATSNDETAMVAAAPSPKSSGTCLHGHSPTLITVVNLRMAPLEARKGRRFGGVRIWQDGPYTA